MSEIRGARILIRDRQVNGGSVPSDALMGEPFVNLYNGILKFSGVTGGDYEPSSQTGIFEVGSVLYNSRISNRLSVNGNFIISGDTGIISTYNGTTGSGLDGKFLSGTTTGFVLGNISDIQGVKTRVQPGVNVYTGGTADLPTVNVVDSPSFNNVTFSGTATGGVLNVTSISGGTIYSGSTDLYDIFLTSGDLSGTTVSAGSNIDVSQVGIDYQVSVVASPSFNNINFSGTAIGGSLSATSITASTLTNTRVLFAGANGLITDDAGMTYNSSTDVLTVNGNLTTNGTQYSGGTIVDDGIFRIDAVTQVEIDSALLPTTHLSYNLGAIGQRWNRVFARSFHAGLASTEYGDGYITGDSVTFIFNSGDLSVNGDILPSATTTYDIGSSSLRWNNIYTKDLDVSGAISTTGITVSGLLAGSVVYAGSGGQLKTETGFAYNETTDTLSTKYITIGSPGQTGTTATIYGDVLIVGEAISGFTSELYIEDNLIELNFNPTASTESTSLGAGFGIQDGSGIAGTDVFFDIRGTSTGVVNRGFATNLNDIYIRESGTVSSPNGVRVIAENDVIDGGSY